MIIEGTLTTGDFLAFTLLLGFMIAPIVQMSNIGSQLTEAFAGLDRTEEIMNMQSEANDEFRTIELVNIVGNVEFKDVSFSYEKGKEVVRNISFKADKGTVTALVGSSGSGKSTLASLVASFINPDLGVITIDGNDISKVSLNSFRSQLGVVLQDDFLFEGTIRDNILFPRPDASETQLLDAVNAAYVNEFTDRFDDGLDTLIGERGVKLSGGQRQRVALARAIVREPNVFLMDEPLSNLDAKLRVSTRHQIKNLSHELQVTTIYVTHDQIEAMTLADRVVVMNKGIIQQVGTPTEIYDKPNNVFVAGFIGSPAMNLIEGEISNGSFEADNIKIAGFGKKLSGKITLGFRAEDAEMTKKGNAVAPLYSIELLGDATISTMRLGGAICSIKGPKDYRAKIGQSVSASIPQKACHLFDPQSGERIV